MILLNVNAELLYAWLTDCIELARQEQALNPLRPQAQRLVSARLEMQHVPYYLRSRAEWFVGVYARLPVEAPPLGDPLLIVGGCRLAEDRIGIRIYRADGFPLLLHEVAWSLEERFPVDPSHPSLVPDYLRPQHRTVPPPPPSPPVPPAVDPAHTANPSPAQSRSGHPRVLAVNLWLEQRMARLPDPTDYDSLFDAWEDRYLAEQGIRPRDPRRSFERAADSALRRLGRGNQVGL
jgi:hypothetical protein